MGSRETVLFGLSAAWMVIFGTVVLVFAAIVGTALWLQFEGGLISQHTQNVRRSMGYVDAQNSHCEQDVTDYTSAKSQYDRDAGNPQAQSDDLAHMNADVADCRVTVGQLSPGEVAAPVAQFLAAHPQGGES